MRCRVGERLYHKKKENMRKKEGPVNALTLQSVQPSNEISLVGSTDSTAQLVEN
jgi:hypothetical protein